MRRWHESLLQLLATIEFSDGSKLHLNLIVQVGHGFLQWREYSFHFRDGNNQLIFRYDNSPHYPRLPFFPHHKHIGLDEDIEGGTQPSIHQIARDIAQYFKGTPSDRA